MHTRSPDNAYLLSAEQLHIAGVATLSLHIQRGEILCLSGPSGSGKSRLLRALADIDPCTGKIFANGQEQQCVSPSHWRSKVMLVPAHSAWWHHCAADHFVHDMTAQAREIGLSTELLAAPIEQLSTGERARAALIRALSRNPDILLLDEPTSALDAHATKACEDLLQQWLTPQRGILWISHNREQIQRVASRHVQLTQRGLLSA